MASTGFIRRYTQDPGLDEITKIEGVVIIDNSQPALASGSGAGLACCVAEFEDGPFVPLEVASSTDFLQTYGSFGFTYGGVVGTHPCARSRKADNAINPEYWNGNGYVALSGKKFNRLACVRVDTSVGSVVFSGLASILGATGSFFDLEPGQVLSISKDGGALTSATFNATAPTRVSAAGTYPSTFTGGESLTFAVDGISYTAVFLSTDSTQTQVIARLNAACGFTAFSNTGGNITTLSGRQRGTGGSVQIVAVSGVLVTTATGFSAGAVVNGTGNVANIDAVTPAEVNTIVAAAVAGTSVEQLSNGQLRLLSNTALTGTLSVGPLTTALNLGFAVGATGAAVGASGTIPAGTRVQTAGAVVFVTMQSVTVSATSAGPYRVKVRHAVDDGTGTSQLTAAISTLTGPLDFAAFSVLNDLPTTAALTEAQLDVAYLAAFALTEDVTGVSKEIDVIWSARQSNTIRNGLRNNVRNASANGCHGRRANIRPPLGTTRANARSTNTQPGVGATREERVNYCFPEAATLIPQIAIRGLSGGAGFSADGIVDVGADAWLASVISQINPEENPGQDTPYLSGAVSLGRNNPDIQTMNMSDYVLFKRAGICAMRFDSGDAFFESGVTSVDPTIDSGKVTIARRRMADYIQDQLAPLAGRYTKKLQSIRRRADLIGDLLGFLENLKTGDPQRIDDYSLDGKTGNTKAAVAAGAFRVIIVVKTLSDFGDIVLDTTIGTTVSITSS